MPKPALWPPSPASRTSPPSPSPGSPPTTSPPSLATAAKFAACRFGHQRGRRSSRHCRTSHPSAARICSRKSTTSSSRDGFLAWNSTLAPDSYTVSTMLAQGTTTGGTGQCGSCPCSDAPTRPRWRPSSRRPRSSSPTRSSASSDSTTSVKCSASASSPTSPLALQASTKFADVRSIRRYASHRSICPNFLGSCVLS